MILPRADPPTDPCPPGHASCLPYNSGTPKVDDHISYLPKFGPKRYIGIMMVILLLVVVVVCWWFSARRRAANSNASNSSNLNKNIEAEVDSPPSETAMNSVPKRSWFCMGKRKSLLDASPSNSTGTEMKKAADSPPSGPGVDATSSRQMSTSETAKGPRWMSDARVPKGLVKEVSGGMVVYTNGSKSSKGTGTRRPKPTVPPPRRDRVSRSINLNSEWHLEHIDGVRYEARTPPEDARSLSNTTR